MLHYRGDIGKEGSDKIWGKPEVMSRYLEYGEICRCAALLYRGETKLSGGGLEGEKEKEGHTTHSLVETCLSCITHIIHTFIDINFTLHILYT